MSGVPVPTRRGRATGAGTLVVLVALVALVLAGCTPATPAAAPRRGVPSVPAVAISGYTYHVPDPLPPGPPGRLLAASDLGPDPEIAGAERWELLYHSTDVDGQDIAVSGALFVPPGPPPPGGWPVVSWGHGTTGMADRCAPSETANQYYDEYAQEVASFVRAGYAVAATDYPGLGTPGLHSYLIGVDEGNSMVDVVTASHTVDPGLSPDWFAVGHSQGGQAVLFATRAAGRAPSLHLLASVAVAPASGLSVILPAVLYLGDTSDLSYGVYSLIGLSAVDPSVDLDRLLGPAGRVRLPLILVSGCLADSDASFTGVTPSQIFDLTGAQVRSLSASLSAYGDPDLAPVDGPVLVVQGSTDQDVPPEATAQVVAHLQALGSDVTEKVYPGLDHDQVLGPSICAQLGWLADHGGRPLGHCVPYSTNLS